MDKLVWRGGAFYINVRRHAIADEHLRPNPVLSPRILVATTASDIINNSKTLTARLNSSASPPQCRSPSNSYSLEHRGLPIGNHDLLIAAHALALDVTLVTANVREF